MQITHSNVNGLPINFVQLPNSHVASVQFWFRAGSAYENPSEQGIAHFLEHMLFKRSKNFPEGDLTFKIESLGAELNAFTSFDYTCYYLTCPSNKLPKAMDYLMEMVVNPVFIKSDIVPEREVVLEEYSRSQDSPHNFSFQNIQKTVFSKGYSHPILGKPKTIKGFEKSDLVSFRKRHYHRGNAMLLVAGEFKSIKPFEKLASKYRLPAGKADLPVPFKLKKTKSAIDLHSKDVASVTLTFVLQSPPLEDELAPVEDLFFAVLGSGETSILHQSLVKRMQIATAANASTMFFADGGVTFMKLVVQPDKAEQALKGLTEVLEQLSKEGIHKFDVEKIKNQYIASKVYQNETIENLAFTLGHGFAQDGDIHSEQKFIDAVKSTNSFQVNEHISKFFQKELKVFCQHPENFKTKSLEKALQKFSDNFSKLGRKSEVKAKSSGAFQSSELKPGIHKLYRYSDRAECFSMHAYLKGGLSDESLSNNGLYFLTGRLLSSGSKNFTYSQVKETVDYNAAQFSGFSGKNAYGITMTGLQEHFEELSQLFFDGLTRPIFDPEIFQVEKDKALHILQMQKKDPVKIAFELFNKEFFGDHPYGYKLLGSEKSLNHLKPQDLFSLHQKNLFERELVIGFSGHIDHEVIEQAIKENLKDLPSRKSFFYPQETFQIPESKFISKEIDREQTQIYIGRENKNYQDLDQAYVKILTQYLSGQSSPLFTKVRDELGLCYVIQAVNHLALQGGHWGVFIGTDSEKAKFASQVLRELLAELAEKGFSKKDFQRTKDIIKAQHLMSLQSNEDHLEQVLVPYLHGLGHGHEDLIMKTVEKISLEEFNEFIRKFLSTPDIEVRVGKI